VRDPSSGKLYISDTGNNRVMAYLSGASSGTVVAGGNAAGNNNTQLNNPIGLWFDSPSNSLFIANYYTNNIVQWTLGGSTRTLIAGSINGTNGTSSGLLYYPVGISLDPMGNIYVADSYNHRIQLFLAGQTAGITIAGITNSPGNNSTLLNAPFWVALDNQLNLYVADTNNHRIQMFQRY
jgi:sugar lactone lactonase YvrE